MLAARMTVGFLLGLALATPARADGDCAVTIRGDGLRGRWLQALTAVQRALAERADVDRCVELVVVPELGGVRAIARLPDGSAAVRHIESPDDIAPTILALLLIPPAAVAAVPTPAPAPVVPDAPPPPAVSRSAPVTPVAQVVLPAAPAERAPAETARFELGLAAGTAWHGEATMGLGGHAHVALGRWRVGASALTASGLHPHELGTVGVTLQSGQLLAARYTLRAVEVGVDLGRSIRLGSVELVAHAGPRVAVLKHQTQLFLVDIATMDPPSDRRPLELLAREAKVVRIGGGVRALWTRSSRLRLVLSLDASADAIDDAANRETATIATPLLPTWAIALSLGGQIEVWP